MKKIPLNPDSLYILHRFLQSEGVKECVTKLNKNSWIIQEPKPNTSRSNNVEVVYANSQVVFEGPHFMVEAYFQIFYEIYEKEIWRMELHQIETGRSAGKVVVYTAVAIVLAILGIAYTLFLQNI